jgi:hypothetical protein
VTAAYRETEFMPSIPKRFAGHFLPNAKLSKSHLAELKLIDSLFQAAANGTRTATDLNPVPKWNRFTSDPEVSPLLKVPARTRRLRDGCERALAVFCVPLKSVRLDYAGAIRRLVALWEQVLPEDDLPDRIRKANVGDRIDARRIVQALLRRLDRIENRQAAGCAAYQSNPISAAALAPVMRGAAKDYIADSEGREEVRQPPHPVWIDQPYQKPVPVFVVGTDTEPTARLRFDDCAHTITIDGTRQIPVDNFISYQVFKVIAGAAPGKVLRAAIREAVADVQADKAIPQALRELPEELRDFIHSSTHGYWLRMPPRPKNP